ncbi:PREDICTED: uncharacterized protein LOC107071777 [Polistes dominula]|uniref:Uncharacterized protein LOC107071777 n=1 Tax=Polistes dominula TaxID=743375 RepID=A0ABM1J259_POLDO|nr:PREDICTED: uncharacterized protein LOC107071777 [Polistes dominula]
MFSITLTVVLFVILSFVNGQFVNNNNTKTNNESLDNVSNSSYVMRQKKFFPFFSVIRFANSQCLASNSLNGTCFTRRECNSYGGTPSGTCANGLGICCIFQKSCGSTTNINNTYFINPGYPTTYKGGERCTITINKCNSDICQIRLDFIDFSLAQPNENGTCDFDLFLVSGASSSVPRICGENSNQHVYADFNGASPITISIGTNGDYPFDRRWNIRIQQIACDSLWRVPNGCLQYYKSISDTVTSFNYGTTVNSRQPDVATREMVNLNYGVCVRMALGYCSIEWSQSNMYSFSISGVTGGFLDPTLPGTSAVADSGLDCIHDFVIVPNPSENGIPLNTERFCGNAFITKTSSLKPFVLYVVTNDNDVNDTQNKGFQLRYRQLPCAV